MAVAVQKKVLKSQSRKRNSATSQFLIDLAKQQEEQNKSRRARWIMRIAKGK